MSKSSIVVLTSLMLILGGLLMVSLNSLGSFEKYIEAGKELTSRFMSRGEIETKTKVRVAIPQARPKAEVDSSVVGLPKRPEKSNGVEVHISPTPAFLKLKGGLAGMATLIVRDIAQRPGFRSLNWIELIVSYKVPSELKPKVFRTYYAVDDDRSVGRCTPPLPEKLP